MKLKTLTGVSMAALALASIAIAAPPSGKGKPPKTGPGCKPMVSVVLTGKLAADGAAAPSTLSVTVTGGNRFARAYKKGTQPVPVALTTSTKVNRSGDHMAADLKSGDRVNIHARSCAADLANGATPALTATRVVAHPSA
ncbi:MAG TPA: hypothetical protein VFQ96_01750 [Microbacteriaceae bacterium]|nr:hypothetical protein [Microbacteriaceae bacterium]